MWVVEKQIKPFSDEEKLRIANRQSLRNANASLHTEGKWYQKKTWISRNEDQPMENT